MNQDILAAPSGLKDVGCAKSPPAVNERRTDIQGLRAVAVMLVVAFHAGLPVPGGYVGVDVFFVISGFVITALLLRELEATGKLHLVNFCARRVRRLLPALALVSIAVLTVSLFVLSPLGSQQTAAWTGSATSLFVANLELFLSSSGYFAAPTALNPFLHTWSLAVEEQYYLFFPALLLVAWKFNKKQDVAPRNFLLYLLGGLTGMSFLLCLVLTQSAGFPFHGRNINFAFYSLPTRAWEFGVGAVLALLPLRRWLRPNVATILGALGLLVLSYCAVRYSALTVFPGAAALLPVFAAGSLLAAGSNAASFVNRGLGVAPLRFLGDLSYSWYLWHWPCIVFIRVFYPASGGFLVPAVAIASLLPAWVSYRFVENPIRISNFWRGRRLGYLSIGAIALPLSFALALLGVAQVGDASIRDLRDQRVPHLDATRGCTGNLPSEARTESSCTWHFPGSTGKVVLIGDSNAGQLIEGLLPAAQALHLDVTLATYGACPFVRIEMSSPTGAPDAGCRAFVAAWTGALAKQPSRLVVIASASADYFIHDTHVAFRALAGGAQASTDSDKQELWRKGTSSVLDELSGGATRVLWIHTLPHFVNWNIYGCPGVTVYRDAVACGRRESRNKIIDQQRAAKEAEQSALQSHPLSLGADLFNAVCPGEICSTNEGNRWLYRDGGHVTVGEAKRLTPQLEDSMRAALNLR